MVIWFYVLGLIKPHKNEELILSHILHFPILSSDFFQYNYS